MTALYLIMAGFISLCIIQRHLEAQSHTDRVNRIKRLLDNRKHNRKYLHKSIL